MGSILENSESTDHAGGNDAPRIRLCVVVTVDITLLNLCRGRFEYLTSHGFDITVVCAPTPHREEIESRGVRLFTAPLTRSITPGTDLSGLWQLYRLFRREKFDLVEVSTPKAALLGSIAARFAGIRGIVHLLRGLTYEEQAGLQKWLIKVSQTIPCRLADEVISISRSMMEQAVDDGLCASDCIRVLGSGSSNGVDLSRFSVPSASVVREKRAALGIPDGAVVVGFVGRMTGDKGIEELVGAFEQLSREPKNIALLLVGDYEDRDRPSTAVMDLVKNHDRIIHVGWQMDTSAWYGLMDMLVLPTYREGFGTVLLEAAAMRLPVVTTDIVGCRDAVAAGETALVVPPQDTIALRDAIAQLFDDDLLRTRLGENGRQRVEREFVQEDVWRRQRDALRHLWERNRF